MSHYLDYSPLIDTGLVVALALIVWAAYRELRNRKQRNLARNDAMLD